MRAAARSAEIGLAPFVRNAALATVANGPQAAGQVPRREVAPTGTHRVNVPAAVTHRAEVRRQLRRIGVNLNQIARAANTRVSQPETVLLEAEQLADLRFRIKQVTMLLAGKLG